MPISAIGSAERTRGFTLVELLVVLALVGLLSAAVVLAMPDGSRRLTAEAEIFAARARAAQEAAVLGARPIALRVGGAGYGFDTRDDGGWTAMASPPFVDRAWAEGIVARPEGVRRIVFDPTGGGEPAEVLLTRDDASVGIVFRGDGAIDVAR